MSVFPRTRRLHLVSILVLHLTVGLLTGAGFGLMYLPAWDIIEVSLSHQNDLTSHL